MKTPKTSKLPDSNGTEYMVCRIDYYGNVWGREVNDPLAKQVFLGHREDFRSGVEARDIVSFRA
jgi:hypothetical protein